MYIKLIGTILLPTLFTVSIYVLNKKKVLSGLNTYVKQVLIGITFGLIACVLATFGSTSSDELIRLSDSAILCSGLIFGGPAGIISGIICSIYCYFASFITIHEFIRTGLIVGSIVAGVYAAFARRFMFENKMPSWVMGLFVGITMEVVHFNLLFSANVNDFKDILKVLNVITIPSIVANGVAVCIPILIITVITKEPLFMRTKSKARISQTIQAWLLGTVLVALICSSLFTFSLQAMIANMDTESIMSDTISDVKKDIIDASDDNLLKITESIASEIVANNVTDYNELVNIADSYNVDEINRVNKAGIIYATTNNNYMGFDMRQGEQSAEFMCLIDGFNRKYVQRLMPLSYNSSINMKYAGVRLGDGGFVQVGYSESRFYSDIKERIALSAVNRHIGSKGYVVITDNKFAYQSYRTDSDILYLSNSSGPSIFGEMIEGTEEYTIVNGNILNRDVFCMYTTAEGYYIIGVYPADEAYFTRNVALYANVFTEIIIFAVLFAVIYILIRVIVVNNIFKVNQSLAQITGGNLDTVVDVRNNEEFSMLSNDINSTVDTLKKYIAEAASRIDAELQYAKDIQASALPHIEPNFVGKNEYELYACMFTAKEVGGDFYDFYYVDDNHLAITIADVSGKGIPAALFMMTSKTMLRNMIESGMSIEEAMTSANERLCENNDANMFVTVWAAIIDLQTGLMEFGNAGHNHPVIRKKDGSYEFLKSRPGMVLAGVGGVHYRRNEYKLEAGDILFLYTDGVTEATNINNELFGDDKLIESLNNAYKEDISMEEVCNSVKKDVDLFVDEAPQFDDITMLAYKFK
ncbi:MAG: SpoIIE family protein phosphatase [Lachnospiraceae bacterium]|nr:SpoIIE family protein phosphatase [Lachnospiraceae bacterium]